MMPITLLLLNVSYSMIFHINFIESVIVGVPTAHQIYLPPTFCYGPDRKPIPSHKQSNFPGMNTSSYPRMDANGHHTHHNATLPSNGASRFQFPNEDQLSRGQSFNH